MPGDAVSFVVDDTDIVKTPSRTGSRAGEDGSPPPPLPVETENGNTYIVNSTASPNFAHHFSTENPLTAEKAYELEKINSKSSESSARGWSIFPVNSKEVPVVRKLDSSTDHIDINLRTQSLQPMNGNDNLRRSSARSSHSNISLRIIEQLERLKQKIISPRTSFLFTDFSPRRFAKIRILSNISTESYLESFRNTTMPSFSEGKSGAFLYYSADYRYIVKVRGPFFLIFLSLLLFSFRLFFSFV
jgi:hypothetical protein